MIDGLVVLGQGVLDCLWIVALVGWWAAMLFCGVVGVFGWCCLLVCCGA